MGRADAGQHARNAGSVGGTTAAPVCSPPRSPFLQQSTLLATRTDTAATSLRAATAALPLVLLGPPPSAGVAAADTATWLGLDVGAADVLPSPPSDARLRTLWQHAVRKYMGPRRASTSSLSAARGCCGSGECTTISTSSASLTGGDDGGCVSIGGAVTRRSVDSALRPTPAPPLRLSRRGAPARAAAGRAAAAWRGQDRDTAPPRSVPPRDDMVTPPPTVGGGPPPCVWGTPVLPPAPAAPSAAAAAAFAALACSDACDADDALLLPPLCPSLPPLAAPRRPAPGASTPAGAHTAGGSPSPSRGSDATAAGVPLTDLADALDDVSLAEGLPALLPEDAVGGGGRRLGRGRDVCAAAAAVRGRAPDRPVPQKVALTAGVDQRQAGRRVRHGRGDGVAGVTEGEMKNKKNFFAFPTHESPRHHCSYVLLNYGCWMWRRVFLAAIHVPKRLLWTPF